MFQTVAHEGPGYLASFLDQQQRPWELVRLDQGEAVPSDPGAFAGLVCMGGPMSVHDGLPWIARLLALFRAAVAQDIPLLGHCLGGQLLAVALGGGVGRNPVKELGWGQVHVVPGEEAARWLGDVDAFDAFHWHGETFSIPPGATCLLSSPWCAHQMFARGKHLAMQCHVEVTPAMIAEWCVLGAQEIEAAWPGPAVQDAATMQAQAPLKVPPMRAVADHVYRVWLQGVVD